MVEKAGTDWEDWEIDMIVADYFAMRNLDYSGQPYVKSHHNAALQKAIGRSRGSIEFKHQNISAVLMRLSEPWITGYKPAWNFQGALVGGVERYLKRGANALRLPESVFEMAEDKFIFLEQAPAQREALQTEIPALERLVRKFDPAARDARNRDLGLRGEEVALRSEHARLKAAGHSELAKKVRWVAREDGDGAGYDILSFANNGEERFLEVKTTSGHKLTPFYISSNEKSFAEECPDRFRLYRLYDFAKQPKAFTLQPPLESHLTLDVTQYLAGFR